jgi:hypothetical protein
VGFNGAACQGAGTWASGAWQVVQRVSRAGSEIPSASAICLERAVVSVA